MRVSRMISGLALTALALMVLAPGAWASNETATSELTMTPVSGQLFEELPVPVNWEVAVEIKAPPESPAVTPLKEIHAQLPKEMSFNPDPKMPVCPDSKIGPATNLAIPPEVAIKLCPESVVGNGTAEHYISGTNNPNGPTLRDAVVVIFNGGRTAAGLPKIKIYGFSQQVGLGIYMEGVLKDGKLDVSIPYLPFDSATGKFHLYIPGDEEVHPERRGQDPRFVRTTCATGEWNGQVDFLLGKRDSAGDSIGPETTLFAPPLTIKCLGVPGRAGLSKPRVKGPAAVKAGQKATYRVMVRNSGSATAKGLKVSTGGRGAKGKVSAGSLAPAKDKTVKVKVKFSREGRSNVKFKVSGKGLKAKAINKKVIVS